MTSSAKWFLLFLAAFLDARRAFSSTRARFFLLALLLGALFLFATAPAQAQTIAAPTDLTVTPGYDTLEVSWTAVAGAILYEVSYTSAPQMGTGAVNNTDAADPTLQDPAAGWVVSNLVAGGETSWTIVGLNFGTRYRVRVRVLDIILGTEGDWAFGTGMTQVPVVPQESPLLDDLELWAGGEEKSLKRGAAGSSTGFEAKENLYQVTVPYDTVYVAVVPTWTAVGATGTVWADDAGTGETISQEERGVSGIPSLVRLASDGAATNVFVKLYRRIEHQTTYFIRVLKELPAGLSVHATPACSTTVTDTSVHPSYALVLTPAPSEDVETESRFIAGNTTTWAPSVLSIRMSGSSIYKPRDITFAQLRNAYPGFMGFEFRLKDTPSVTAQCLWTFTEDPVPPQPPPPPAPPAVSVPPTGGGSPPGETSDPFPPSTPCGESDKEYLEMFYEATGGEDWHQNEYWNSEELLGEWFGVETDEDGSVISLRLESNGLSGKIPEELLSCFSELKELALWGNDDLSAVEIPEDLLLAVERAALREIAETLNLNPEWFEDYEEPFFNFEDWHSGVTTDEDGRVTELDLPGEIPESVISQFRKLREIMTTTSGGGCALSPGGSSAFGLFLLTLFVFAVLGRKRAR